MEKELNVIELFGGIGACTKALKNLGVKVNIIDYVEIDKYACKSYNAINNTNFEPQDIMKWDKHFENIDLITHGSPCQDFSLAGKQQGGDEGSGTRSSLMYETLRIVEDIKPRYVLWENVKNLLSKKHRHNFDNYLNYMNDLGYTNYYQVLNAKDYGIPQNRERVFTISIRNDIDKKFVFPPKEELKLKLKDMLEDEVDEKYYLSGKQIERITTTNYNVGKTRIQEKEYCDTLCARDWKDPKCVEVNRKYGVFDTDKTTHQAGSVYDKNGLCPTLDTMQGGWRQPCIEIKNATKKGYDEATDGDGVNLQYPDSNTRRGRVGHGVSQALMANDSMGVVEKARKDIKEEEKYCEYCGKKLERKRFNGRLEDFTVFKNRKYCNRECMKKDYLKIGDNHNQTYSNAHTTARKINELILHKEECELCGSRINLDIHHIDGNWQNNNLDNLMCLCRSCHTKYERNKNKTNNGLHIRKLTPREVWRLMGFDDSDFEKAEKENSNTQLYKQAGNSIVVNVLEKIFLNLL